MEVDSFELSQKCDYVERIIWKLVHLYWTQWILRRVNHIFSNPDIKGTRRGNENYLSKGECDLCGIEHWSVVVRIQDENAQTDSRTPPGDTVVHDLDD